MLKVWVIILLFQKESWKNRSEKAKTTALVGTRMLKQWGEGRQEPWRWGWIVPGDKNQYFLGLKTMLTNFEVKSQASRLKDTWISVFCFFVFFPTLLMTLLSPGSPGRVGKWRRCFRIYPRGSCLRNPVKGQAPAPAPSSYVTTHISPCSGQLWQVSALIISEWN